VVVAGAVGLEELPVDESLDGQHVRQREHDGDVGAGDGRPPFALARGVVAQRGDGHDAPAAVAKALQRTAGRVLGGATGVHCRVLHADAAETHHQFGVLGDDVPRRGTLEQVVVSADDPGHDDPGGTEAVGVPRKGIAAKEFQESVHLALRVVETTRAGPPVRTAVDGLVSVGVDDAAQLVGEQFGEFFPRHGDELVGATAVRGARTIVEPAAADRGGLDSRLVLDRTGQVAEQG
jgi:hypothetical protein